MFLCLEFLVVQRTLNNEKSALISLLDDWDEFTLLLVAIDDIEASLSMLLVRQISSNLAAFETLVVGGNTVRKRNEKIWLKINSNDFH